MLDVISMTARVLLDVTVTDMRRLGRDVLELMDSGELSTVLTLLIFLSFSKRPWMRSSETRDISKRLNCSIV